MKLEKSCQTEMLMGSQTPSVRIVPDYVYTDGEDAVKILAAGRLIRSMARKCAERLDGEK